MNDLEALTFAQLCGELRVSAKTLRKVTKGNPDFPVLERGSSGRAYRFDKAAAVSWWLERQAAAEAARLARREWLRRARTP